MLFKIGRWLVLRHCYDATRGAVCALDGYIIHWRGPEPIRICRGFVRIVCGAYVKRRGRARFKVDDVLKIGITGKPTFGQKGR